ncbi:restriction endonuclease subunit S [Vibrio atlanticus]|uniref:Type-1 restriction enzyme EcoKI specificity protein n=1 Tax=Vibrio atlanticus TaxID=693153 RepID=A0A1C3IV26_9VIBR|nr:restriction endonuclease subunit S [Vibrio atlanticus]SBS65285.1 Type-1 restriction enzyme EcoKI specificity protein [Vibrio atlanticus]
MRELPKGWIETALGDLCTKVTDGSHNPPKAKDSGFPMFSAKNIQDGKLHFDLGSRLISEDEFITEDKRTRIVEGDVLLTIVGALGRAAVVSTSEKFTLQRSVAVLGAPLISPYFLKYNIESPKFQQQVIENAKGTAQKGIYLKKLRELNIVLPPLAEQKRIVEKLNEVLAQVDTIKARLDGIPDLLKRFRQSVLASAVSGKLTEEWRKVNRGQSVDLLISDIESERKDLKAAKKLKPSFGKHEPITYPETSLPNSWSWVCFDQISANVNNALKAGPFGSALKKSDCTDSGYRVYGQEQVIAGDETLVSYYINEDKYTQLEACSVKSGDILISLVGTIGKVLILSDKVEQGIINPRLVKLSLNESIQRQYVKAYLDSPVAKQFFKGFSHGGTMEILNLGILRKLPIALPPVDEQKEIVRLVGQYFTFADTIEAQVKKAQVRVDNLTQSILAKAFRGELVDQDPNDEPAEKLLERIAEARKEAEALAKAAKKAEAAKKKAEKAAAKG